MKGGNGATIGSGITHSPTGEQNRGVLAAKKPHALVREVRKVLKIVFFVRNGEQNVRSVQTKPT